MIPARIPSAELCTRLIEQLQVSRVQLYPGPRNKKVQLPETRRTGNGCGYLGMGKQPCQ